jgi:hypothetical protein
MIIARYTDMMFLCSSVRISLTSSGMTTIVVGSKEGQIDCIHGKLGW